MGINIKKQVKPVVKIKIVTSKKTFKVEIERENINAMFQTIMTKDWIDLEGAIINNKDVLYAEVIE